MAYVLGINIDLSSPISVIGICKRKWSSQVHDVILFAIIHVFWFIWVSRNKARFDNFRHSTISIRHLVSAAVALSGSLSAGSMSNSMEEFAILKAFKIKGHVSRASKTTQVSWIPPPCGWVKCNTDGASRGNPGHASGAGIFRGSIGDFMGCFSIYLGIESSLFGETSTAILAIELASKKGWANLWLECDSQMVVAAFSNSSLVHWKLKTRWLNCLDLVKKMKFTVSRL